MTQGEITRASLQSEVIRRAWESMQFKQKLLARPREALQEMGYTLDEDVEVMVVQEHKKKLVLVLPESPLSTAQQQIMGPTIPASTLGCPQTVSGCEPTLGSDCGWTRDPDCIKPPKPTFQCPTAVQCPLETGSSCQPTFLACPRPPSTGSSCQPTWDCKITSAPDCIRPEPTAICPPATLSGCPETMKVCPSDTWDCAPTMNCPPPPPTVGCPPNPGKP